MKLRIRKGGLQTDKEFLFELSGGDVSLDLVNTVDLRPGTTPKELIPSYEDLVSWARQDKLINASRELALRRMAKRNPERARKVHRLTIELRECLFLLFSHVAEGREVPAHVLSFWNRMVLRSISNYQMSQSKEGMAWTLKSESLALDSFLWPVVQSAIDLLTGPNATRIRKCDAPECDWVFLDQSKRGNRRWCDMTVCGNRAKARRFYSKKRL